MSNRVVTAVSLLSAAVGGVAIAQSPAEASSNRSNYIGPAAAIGSNGAFGLEGRFVINNELSIRPNLYFPKDRREFGAAMTYDFNSTNVNGTRLSPYAGGGVQFSNGEGETENIAYLTGGTDIDLNDNFALKAALNVPLSSRSNNNVNLIIGGMFRF
jgi:hypothetical protein